MLKNVTLSAEVELIRKAREKAQREHTTLNAEFRHWLQRYVSREASPVNYQNLMERLAYVVPDKTFSRDELNARREEQSFFDKP